MQTIKFPNTLQVIRSKENYIVSGIPVASLFIYVFAKTALQIYFAFNKFPRFILCDRRVNWKSTEYKDF